MPRLLCLRTVALLALFFAVPTQGQPAAGPFFPGATYDDGVSTPGAVLGYKLGSRPASHAEIERCVQTWASQSERAAVFEYARSFEDRSLNYVVITSPKRLTELGDVRADLARLADPRGVSDAEASRLLRRTPAVAWFAYSIHGDELSGADAALAAMYHLCAAEDDAVKALLDDVVVIIDPLMNPDGRDRYIQQMRERRGTQPDVDDQSTLHGGSWPWGRTNHYQFDLNRDWILGVNPETRGRIRAVGEWYPLLFVDAHEMGSQDTFLFSPSREPINPNLPMSRRTWWNTFARDQAADFDRHGWRYYTGEWADEWYPGYSNSWSTYRGAIGILYEQAGVDYYGVRRPEGRVLTYREAVHHQLVSTMSNLTTLHRHRDALKEEFLKERRAAVSESGPYAARTFAIVPSRNASRTAAFTDLMRLQGFEVHEATESFTVSEATDRLGRSLEDHEFPAGTLLLPNRQPEAHLLAAMLEFDPRMTDEFLARERREILKNGSTLIYDITGWNVAMLHDVEAYELAMGLPEGVRPYMPASATGGLGAPQALQGWVVDGADDASVAIAMRLLESGVQVRVSDRAFAWGERAFARGSLVITREDNRTSDPNWIDLLDNTCRDLGVVAHGVDTGLGDGDIADIGGEHFILLQRPRIGLVTRSPVSSYDAGSIWLTLDQRVRAPVTLLDAARLGSMDLRRYNVLIVPSAPGRVVSGALGQLESWVKAGGTLVAIGGSARALASSEDSPVATREISDVLDRLDEFELQLLREFASNDVTIDSERTWSQTHGEGLTYPWAHEDFDDVEEDERERRDEWQQRFMPQGVLLAGRTDAEHWLTFGCGADVPVMFAGDPVLMAPDGVEAPIRLGRYVPGEFEDSGGQRIGWVTTPREMELRLRMSGLLWPEAVHRIANGAWVMRERVGRGQVILFASSPTFRAAALGTTRALLNAVVYGPGCGASTPLPR